MAGASRQTESDAKKSKKRPLTKKKKITAWVTVIVDPATSPLEYEITVTPAALPLAGISDDGVVCWNLRAFDLDGNSLAPDTCRWNQGNGITTPRPKGGNETKWDHGGPTFERSNDRAYFMMKTGPKGTASGKFEYDINLIYERNDEITFLSHDPELELGGE